MADELPLLHTYIEGLDRALGGGIPKGSTILVAGTPGTMKTSLALWMMRENARENGTKSLYVGLEQSADGLRSGAARMGMGELKESQVYILDLAQLRRGMERSEASKDWVSILLEIIKEAVNSTGYQILALDSLEALYALTEMKNPRREMYHFLTALKELGLSTFVITETPFGAQRLAQWGEDFLADGILQLRQVEVGETEVQLAPKEFDLLWELLDHRGLVLTRDQLLERVWGYTFAGDTRTVDVHVAQLRRKLGKAERIRTIRGAGYKLIGAPPP